MNLQICTGKYEKFGVTKEKDILSFSLQAGENANCNLLLYPKGEEKAIKIPMERHSVYPTVYTIGIQGIDCKEYDYNFEIDGKECLDPYAKRIVGREVWAEEDRRPQEEEKEAFVPEKIKKQRELHKIKKLKEIKSGFYFSDFRWKNDANPRIKKEDMVIYKLHARGFTMGLKTESDQKGTFAMVERKLSYLKELGVTSLLFLPVYEFEEFLQLDESKREEYPANLVNYWGYTAGSYFAPKASYLGPGNNPDALKKLIQKMHHMGMEFMAEFYFDKKVNPHLIIDIMRYWRQEYHVDGFRILGSFQVAELLAQDSMLSGCKLFFEGFSEELASAPERLGPELFTYNDAFLYQVRRLLNHQGGNIYEFACQMKRQQEHQGFVNYAAENNGFTLMDVFSYGRKHNEDNLEENRDGSDWCFSSNSGQEGATKKREIIRLREQKVRNALAATVFSQGVPLIWMGDECGNTQNGNNNAYCQDNEIGWKDWKNTKASRQMILYLKKLLELRREYPVLRSPRPYQMMDYEKRGYPDLSYHSEAGWQIDFDRNRGYIGMFYCGDYGGGNHLYIAYNFQNEPQKMALPREIAWQVVFDTSREVKDIRTVSGAVMTQPQSFLVLSGKEKAKKAEKPEKAGKTERIGKSGGSKKTEKAGRNEKDKEQERTGKSEKTENRKRKMEKINE